MASSAFNYSQVVHQEMSDQHQKSPLPVCRHTVAAQIVPILLSAMVGMCTLSATSVASDYYHQCSDASGDYHINDGQLTPTGRGGVDISYTTNAKTTLRLEKGHCVSNNCGRKYAYENHKYLMNITFRHNGSRNTLDFICELASDGLPANCQCSQQVTTLVKTLQPAYATASPGDTNVTGSRPSDWNHNGSAVYLLATGAKRQFRYRLPRPRMRKACAREDDLVFEGTRRGNRYVGVAYVYSCDCGPIAYDVSGKVANNDRRVTLNGKAPRRNKKCEVVSYRADTLVFNLIKGRD